MHLAGQPSAEALGYLYDSRGNVTQRRPGGFNRQAHDFIVDKANRTTQLRAIGSSQPLETYLYDGNGRRVQITDAHGVRVQIYNQAGQFVYETSTPVASSTCSSATPPNLIFCSGFEAQQGSGNPTSTRHIHLAGKQIARTSITSGNPIATTTFVHTDLLGSVVAESTQAPPQITHRPLHEPFGAPSTGTCLQGPDYAGHVTDSVKRIEQHASAALLKKAKVAGLPRRFAPRNDGVSGPHLWGMATWPHLWGTATWPHPWSAATWRRFAPSSVEAKRRQAGALQR